MKAKISWYSLVVFAFLTIAIAQQQGHPTDNTFFFIHKTALLFLTVAGIVVSGYILKKNTNN